MTDRPQDAELRARFAAQRRADANDAPSFAVLMARARAGATAIATARTSHRRLRQLVYGGCFAAAAAAAGLLLIQRPTSSEAAFEQAVRAFQNDPALGAWRSPTAALLEIPGSQLMSTTPRIGTPQ